MTSGKSSTTLRITVYAGAVRKVGDGQRSALCLLFGHMQQSICVFCGSASGASEQYAAAAQEFARAAARRGIRVVYGGASVGLMGVLADTVLAEGGEIIGVIPGALLEREIAHRGLSELRVVETMHERKAMMAQLADAFVALPGGLGTFEELFEVWTWGQLGLHSKPYGLFNAAGYYDPLIAFLDHACEEGFVRPAQRTMLAVDDDPNELLDLLLGTGRA
jgi:uncharacterized protein (TIGR00730 family)